REVADLIGLKPDQVRHYVRRALVEPVRGDKGEYRFNFQDVVLLRTAKGLLDANVSARKANKALLKLQLSSPMWSPSPRCASLPMVVTWWFGRTTSFGMRNPDRRSWTFR
ncbi:MAG: helix-turn-helix domain-containing protein, partial [Gammaproteobacteria bacterium]